VGRVWTTLMIRSLAIGIADSLRAVWLRAGLKRLGLMPGA
jgi:hypothetical protein